MKSNLLFLFLLGGVGLLWGQDVPPNLGIGPLIDNIELDGLLHEVTWQEAEAATNFWQQAPRDDSLARFQTEVYMAYDEQYLYVAAQLHSDRFPIVQTLKRDQNPEISDGFGIVLDPLGERTNALIFILNAAGAQSEALLALDDFDINWDQRWYSATQQSDEGWSLEMAIPWRTLRYRADQLEWRANFIRVDLARNEFHTWQRVPLQFEPEDLGYTGILRFDQLPPVAKSNVNLIPFVTGNYEEDHTSGESVDADFTGNAGLDAKVAITPTLNLDVTVNPDFSQADVDRQVTNLSRFNVFFPERRTFFLENADIFSNYGNFTMRPFFSRRIGLGENGLPIPILYGLRLSGGLDAKSRIGLMNVQTEGGKGRTAQNFTALSFNRKVLQRSVVRGYVLNRQARLGNEWAADDYGRNLGAEMDFITADGRWTVNGGYHHSLQPDVKTKNQSVTGTVFYSSRNFRTLTTGGRVGANFQADQGFVPNLLNYDAARDTFIRLGFTRVYNSTDYYIIPESGGRINQHWFGLENNFFFNEGLGLTDLYTRLRYFRVYQNTSMLRFRLNNNYIDLPFPFSFTGGEPLAAKEYNNLEFNVEYNTDNRKELVGSMFVVYGSFYGGTRFNYEAEVTFRRQPWFSLGLSLRQDFLRFPEPFGDADITLLGAEVEVNFRENLFWTTFFQYATQSNNMNINSRLQWRYAPMSDFFLVYTDNYLVEPVFGPRNRSLVAKFTYWLSL